MQLPFTLSHETDAPSSPADSVLYATHAPAWESGVKGDARTLSPGSDNGILTIVIMLLVLVALNMGHIRRLFRNIDSDLFSLRRRQNLFDDHTAKESRTILTLLLQLCVFEGILLFLWLGGDCAKTADTLFLPVAALTGLVSLFYLFQLASCTLLAYVFSDSFGLMQWRRSLNASSVLLGMSLTVPTLVSLFYPASTAYMLPLALGLYVIARITYIIKGFRIFYTNFGSLLYFILYLCALEIIPPTTLYLSALEICRRMCA